MYFDVIERSLVRNILTLCHDSISLYFLDMYACFKVSQIKKGSGLKSLEFQLKVTVCLLASGAFKSRIEKVKIKGFAPAHCISLSSGA